MKEKNYKLLNESAYSQGADLFGVADTERVKKYIHHELLSETEKLPYVVSVGVKLQESVLNTIIDKPNQIYKTHYRQVNAQLDNITSLMAVKIQRMGFCLWKILPLITLMLRLEIARPPYGLDCLV